MTTILAPTPRARLSHEGNDESLKHIADERREGYAICGSRCKTTSAGFPPAHLRCAVCEEMILGPVGGGPLSR